MWCGTRRRHCDGCVESHRQSRRNHRPAPTAAEVAHAVDVTNTCPRIHADGDTKHPTGDRQIRCIRMGVHSFGCTCDERRAGARGGSLCRRREYRSLCTHGLLEDLSLGAETSSMERGVPWVYACIRALCDVERTWARHVGTSQSSSFSSSHSNRIVTETASNVKKNACRRRRRMCVSLPATIRKMSLKSSDHAVATKKVNASRIRSPRRLRMRDTTVRDLEFASMSQPCTYNR